MGTLKFLHDDGNKDGNNAAGILRPCLILQNTDVLIKWSYKQV
jgi:hypothetical protein